MRYTPAQTRWFLDAIDDLERDAHRAAIAAARMAQADKGALTDYLDKLDRRD